MSRVIQIGISNTFKGNMKSVNHVETVAGSGIINDRHFKNNNNQQCQITLIESENIDYFNKESKSSIPYINFRRNIITQGIKLNELVGTEFFIGDVKVKGHDLCRPCKYLQESLKQKNLLKILLRKGGLRCEILTSGKISVGNEIKF